MYDVFGVGLGSDCFVGVVDLGVFYGDKVVLWMGMKFFMWLFIFEGVYLCI